MTRYYNSLHNSCRFNSVSKKIIKIITPVFFTLSVIFITSCEEDPTKIGNSLLPASDFVNIKSTDTLSVWSYTEFDESIRTDNQSVSIIGQIQDPYFGTTTCEFVSQVRLKPAWDDKAFVIDSVKLFMRLYKMKGNSATGYTLNISEISDQIYNDSAYYSKNAVNTTGYNISVQLPELKQDSLTDIKVKMPVSFGEYLTRDTSKLFYSSSKPDFRAFMKGLYFRIKPSGDPLLASLSLASTALGAENYNFFILYMHDASGPKITQFILDATNNNARYNRFVHDFSTASPEKRINHINDGYRDTLSYLQYLNGVYTKITFAGLENIKKNNDYAKVAVNKAKLTIPVYFDGITFKPSTVPSSLRLRYKTEKGYIYDVPDYGVGQGQTFFDGKLDSVNNVYNFNISTYVQLYLQDKTGVLKPELEIYQPPTGTKNVIFRANKNKTPVKFEFIYTKF